MLGRLVFDRAWKHAFRTNKNRPMGGKFVARAASVPFAASGPRVPTKRPRGIPPAVQAACVKMIWEGCDRVEAARTSNLKPDTLRRWLHRPEVVSFLLKEGNAHCQAICAGNVHTLAQIREPLTAIRWRALRRSRRSSSFAVRLYCGGLARRSPVLGLF